MKLYEIVFSPTGGTKKVTAVLSNSLSKDITTINLLDHHVVEKQYALTQNDVALISVPSFGGRVPQAAIERISSIQGNGAKAVLVCVYGNRAYEDTLVELEDIASQAGFETIAAIAAVAEHSIVRQFATGRPDSDDESQLKRFAQKIKEKIQKDSHVKPSIPGNRPYKKSKNAGMIPKPTKECKSCGICVNECSVQAINLKDQKLVNEDLCISCMRCISVCPHSARKVNKVMLAAAGIMLKKACSNRKENELFI